MIIMELIWVKLRLLKISSFNNVFEKPSLKGSSTETNLFQDVSSVAGWLTATFLKKILRNYNEKARHGRARTYKFEIISFNVNVTMLCNFQ